MFDAREINSNIYDHVCWKEFDQQPSEESCIQIMSNRLSFDIDESINRIVLFKKHLEFVEEFVYNRTKLGLWIPDNSVCMVTVTHPPVGAIFPKVEKILLKYTVTGCNIQNEGMIRISEAKVDSKPVEARLFDSCSEIACNGTITLQTIEYGTHAISLSVLSPSGSIQSIFPAIAIFDVVPNSLPPFQPTHVDTREVQATNAILKSMKRRNLNIGVIANYGLDGQKSMWRILFKALRQFVNIRYMSFSGGYLAANESSFRNDLTELQIPTFHSTLSFENPSPLSPDQAFLLVFQSISRLCGPPMCMLASKRRCDRSIYDRIPFYIPRFAVDVIKTLYRLLHEMDILWFANSLTLEDALIPYVGSLIGAYATIMELPNPSPHPAVCDVMVLAPSVHTSQTVPSHLRATTSIINPGIDVNDFVRVTRQHHDAFLVGYVGRLAPEKSVGLIIHAATILAAQEVRFVVVGSGPEETALKMLAKVLRVDHVINFVGAKTRKELPELLSGFDVIVQPTLRGETFCIANIEAMATGVPVITFGIGGVSDYIQDRYNSFVVKHASALELAKTIEHAMQHRDELERMRSNAKETAKKFTDQNMISQYVLFFNSLLPDMEEVDSCKA